MELDGLPSTVMLVPAVSLIFDLLTRKRNHYVSGPGRYGDMVFTGYVIWFW